MALKIGIVGLPNVGKSTLFNALTRSRGAQVANYPFCTIDPNIGIVEVPDPRIAAICAIVHPEKTIPATVEFVDIAGLVRGASKGEGLGNKFLSHIREVQAICHVLRFFPDADILHNEGSVDFRRDHDVIVTELALADLEILNRQLDKLQGGARTGDSKSQQELSLAQKIRSALEEGKNPQNIPFEPDERIVVYSWNLLTMKPVLYAANVSEEQLHTLKPDDIEKESGIPRDHLVMISAKLEQELQDLPPEEGQELLGDLGVPSSGLDRLARSAYDLLGYITFFTAGPKEVRAWTIHQGTRAPQAAGTIHSDFERGFIRAETIAYDDFIRLEGEQGAKDAGKLRTEGKDYIVQDGDVMHFRFNV